MSIELSKLEKLIMRLAEQCEALGLSPAEAIEEKASELELRTFLRCIPNPDLKPAQLSAFLLEILGRTPPTELIDRVTREARGPSIDPEEYLE